jgi:cobalt/nickel transport system permease protein
MSCHAARELDLLGYGGTAIHRLDSRVKLLVALVFIVCIASFSKYAVAAIVPFFFLPLILGILGRTPARLVIRILAVACPFAVLVGLFNPFLDKSPALQIGALIISAGWISFVSILLRFLLSVSMALVLISTTSLPGLLHGLLQMRVPRPFVTQLQFLYRYLFLLVEEGQGMARARALRDPRRKQTSLRLLKPLLASLLWRTWDRADRVYRSMKTRGFQGDMPTLRRDHLHASDIAFLVSGVAACLIARFLPLTEWIGGFVVKGAS